VCENQVGNAWVRWYNRRIFEGKKLKRVEATGVIETVTKR
jgi:hypothetical protein